jgi:hypothetical protein
MGSFPPIQFYWTRKQKNRAYPESVTEMLPSEA